MSKIIELDVRPHLKKKLEPFQIIMDAVKTLTTEDTFVLHATFKPTPLLGLMKTKGFQNKVEKIDEEHWIVTFVHKSMKHLLDQNQTEGASGSNPDVEPDTDKETGDSAAREPQVYKLNNRGLEPPQPMIRTLAKLGEAQSGDKVVIHNDRVPMFLIEELNTLGYTYEIDKQEDESAIVTITKS